MINTSTQVAIFNFEGSSIRTLVDEKERVLYAAKDVALALGYTNTNDAIKRHCRGVVERYPITDSLGRTQEARFLREPDVYRLAGHSTLPSAEKFEAWVYEEVLPQINHTGGYVPAGETEAETLARAVLIAQKTIALKEQQLKEQETKVIMADTLIATDGVCAVSDLARMLTQAGLAIGTNTLFKRMREDGFLSKQKGMNWNRPLQKYIESGVLAIKESIVDLGDGHQTIGITPKVTAKGQEFFLDYYLNK